MDGLWNGGAAAQFIGQKEILNTGIVMDNVAVSMDGATITRGRVFWSGSRKVAIIVPLRRYALTTPVCASGNAGRNGCRDEPSPHMMSPTNPSI